MTIELFSSELRSHPEKLLIDHLFYVGNHCKKILETKQLNLDNFNINLDILTEIAYLIGITHDFGKTTKYFQNYLNNKEKNIYTNHGFLSSIFTYQMIKGYLLENELFEKDYYKYLPILSFLIVKRHHGNLRNADDEIYDLNEDVTTILIKQIDSIDLGKISEIYNKSKFYNIDVKYFIENFKEIIKEINHRKGGKGLIRKLKKEDSIFYYFITILFYSILLDADKTSAADLKKSNRKVINSNIIDKYKSLKYGKSKDNDKINNIRKKIYNEVISKVDDLNIDSNRILSLNVPTGTGKTLTSLSFSLKLRDRIKKEKGFCPRIIYSLPFLSIIDQNYDVLEDIFETVIGKKATSDILLKHHHLSDVIYTTSEDEFENIEIDDNIEKSLLLIEGWNSEIVVTTFIQFFHSLITNRNKAARKFHNIINSIVILDEIQAIPHKYWLLLKKTINILAKFFNTYFIFVTATQPLIFDETKNEIKELVENKKEYFNAFDRIKLTFDLLPINIEKFKKLLKNDINRNPEKNILIVLNTINSSIEIYNYINSLKIDNTQLFYLSTNIIPKERLKRILEIKNNQNENRKIIVSTQLIEAGVDIDCDIVYRDFAPIDSINQIAGRCNRNYGDKGQVKIFKISDENNKNYYNYIYSNFLTEKTSEIFNELPSTDVNESQFLKLNNNYFNKVKLGMSYDESNMILNYVKRLQFQNLSEFKLIKEDYFKIDVFIELDDEAMRVWKKYCELKNNLNLVPFERRKEFLKFKKQFYDYVISVSKKYENQVGFDEKTGLGRISKAEIDQGNGYFPDTGFKRENVGAETLIC